MIHNIFLNDYGKAYTSRTIYITLLIIIFIVMIDISGDFFLFLLTSENKLFQWNILIWMLFMLRMFYHNKIDVSEGIDISKSNKSSKECIMCIKSKERMYFKDIGYKYEPYFYNGCHDISMMIYKLENIAILNVKGVIIDVLYGIWLKMDAVNRLNNSELDDEGLLWIRILVKI